MTDRSADPALWAALSVGAYLAWALLARQFGRAASERLPQDLARVVTSLAGLAAGLTYFVGVPYLALISGVLDLRSLGLSGGEPLGWVPMAALIALATWAVLALAWRRWAGDGALLALVSGSAGSAGDDAVRALAGAVTQQCHLAFYRAVIALAAGAYAGVFAGLGLLVAERLAGAAIRGRWPGDSTAEGEIVLLANLAATSLLFLATNSLLACLLAHLAVDLGIGWVASRNLAPSAQTSR